jgi:nitrate/nitrite transport system ATP-binding protein
MERASTAQLTNGPRAGRIMEADLPRPRSREMLLEHPKYYDLMENLIAFLAEYDGQVSGEV